MASRAVQRRILDPNLLTLSNGLCPSCRFTTSLPVRTTRRHLGMPTSGSQPARPANAFLDEYKKAPSTSEKELAKQKGPKDDFMAKGEASEQSMFSDFGEEPDVKSVQRESRGGKPALKAVGPPLFNEIDREALMNVLDPVPQKRKAWQRKKIIQQIRKRGVLTKAEILKRTERECVVPSAVFKTSTKKLVHLARQIAGKPIDEAIIQMQLSKKRVAQDIMKHLEYSKDLAIVKRGMGLGKAEGRAGEPVEIDLKNGKRQLVTDRTGIYVDQAWVNKGTSNMTIEYRGRGRRMGLTHRSARITVLLKEEATRIRLSDERQEKFRNRKLWLHLPDRPITLQRQYPLW